MTDWPEEWGFIRRHPGLRLGLLACAIAGLVNLGYGALEWWPARSGANELSHASDAARREIAAALRSREIARVYHEAARAVGAVEARLDADGGQAEAVQRANQLARENGVDIVGESNEVGRKQGGFVPLYQSLSMRGRYADLRAFIGALGDLPTWTLVREVRIERARSGGRLRAEVVLVTFRPDRSASEARS